MFVCPDCGLAQPTPGTCPNDRTELAASGDEKANAFDAYVTYNEEGGADPDASRIEVLLGRLEGADRVRRVGLVPQDPGSLLYGETVAEECALADREVGLAAGTTAAVVEELIPGWVVPKKLVVVVDKPERTAWLQEAMPQGVSVVGVWGSGVATDALGVWGSPTGLASQGAIAGVSPRSSVP
mgnify:CR=1 FL=1